MILFAIVFLLLIVSVATVFIIHECDFKFNSKKEPFNPNFTQEEIKTIGSEIVTYTSFVEIPCLLYGIIGNPNREEMLQFRFIHYSQMEELKNIIYAGKFDIDLCLHVHKVQNYTDKDGTKFKECVLYELFYENELVETYTALHLCVINLCQLNKPDKLLLQLKKFKSKKKLNSIQEDF